MSGANRGAQPRPRIVVVGAGAAGIIAAWRAATSGARVTLLEKNDRLGIKILISGGGKCNITHAGEVEDVLRPFRQNEARFLRPSMYRFRNEDILDILRAGGLRVYTRPDGRVFPVEGTAKDVVAILRQTLLVAGVDIQLRSPVVGLLSDDGSVRGVKVSRSGGANTTVNHSPAGDGVEEIPADRVIVCVGGSSYPASGTTGDGWKWVRELGHTIVPVRAALAPINTDPPPEGLAGVALRAVVLKARHQGKEIARWEGDLVFTHRGVSGPCALGISREVVEAMEHGAVTLEIDLLPGQSYEEVREGFIRSAQESPRKSVANMLEASLPESVRELSLRLAGADPSLPGSRLDKKLRNRILEHLKALPLGTVRSVPLEKGEVVAGGVSLDEVDPKTMASKLVRNLYLCGEILDVAGPVGGYNLQAAFSTGYVAGESAALFES